MDENFASVMDETLANDCLKASADLARDVLQAQNVYDLGEATKRAVRRAQVGSMAVFEILKAALCYHGCYVPEDGDLRVEAIGDSPEGQRYRSDLIGDPLRSALNPHSWKAGDSFIHEHASPEVVAATPLEAVTAGIAPDGWVAYGKPSPSAQAILFFGEQLLQATLGGILPLSESAVDNILERVPS